MVTDKMSIEDIFSSERLSGILDNLKRDKINILVCGLLSVGKSALINSIIGKKVCDESDPSEIDPNNAFASVTKKVQSVHARVRGSAIIIWDSPGLQGDTENDASYLKAMYDECQNADIVIFCLDITISRWSQSHIRVTQQFTDCFGEHFWEKCVLVFTKTNMVICPPKNRGQERKYFQQRYRNYQQTFCKQLVDQGLPSSIVENIPVVAAGYNDNDTESELCNLWSVNDESERQQNFLPEVWATCLEKARISHNVVPPPSVPVKQPISSPSIHDSAAPNPQSNPENTQPRPEKPTIPPRPMPPSQQHQQQWSTRQAVKQPSSLQQPQSKQQQPLSTSQPYRASYEAYQSIPRYPREASPGLHDRFITFCQGNRVYVFLQDCITYVRGRLPYNSIHSEHEGTNM